MKRAALYVLLIAGLTTLAGAQTADAPSMNFLAHSVREEGGTVHMKGNVRIAACSVVTADSATRRGSEFELGGKVRLRLTNGVDPLKAR